MTTAALPYFHDGAPGPPPVPTGSSEGTRRSGNTFTYTTSTGATLYEVQVAADSGFTQIIIDGTTAGTTYTSPNTIDTLMANSTTYYWRVRASGGLAWSAWSAGRSFTTQNSRWVVTVPFAGVSFGTLDAVAVHQGTGDVFVLDIAKQTIWVRRAATGVASALATSVAASGGLAIYGDYVWWGAGTSIGYCAAAGGTAGFAATAYGTIHDLAWDYDDALPSVWLAQGPGALVRMPRLKLTTTLQAGPPFAFTFRNNSGVMGDPTQLVAAASGNQDEWFAAGPFILRNGAVVAGFQWVGVTGMTYFQPVNYVQTGHPSLVDAEPPHVYFGVPDQVSGFANSGFGAGNWIIDHIASAAISGQGGAAGYTDGEATAEALWSTPGDVWLTPWRDLYICDHGNGVVRLLAFEIQTAPPRPLSPVSYPLLPSAEVTFSWKPVAWAAHYIVQVSSRSIASFGFYVTGATVTAPTTSLTLLLNTDPSTSNGNDWSWRVAAIDSLGTQYYWSDIVGFKLSPPDQPTLSSPANGATGVASTPTLTWTGTAGADHYDLQVATDAAFTAIVVDVTVAAPTVSQSPALSSATTYYWRVRALQSGNSSSYTPGWSFTTA